MQSEFNRIRYIKEKKNTMTSADLRHVSSIWEGVFPFFLLHPFISYLLATCLVSTETPKFNMSKPPWPNLHLHLLQLPTLPNGPEKTEEFGAFCPKKPG